MEKLTAQIKKSLAGERLASFLPMVKELNAEYDSTTIAAAALQILYDQNCPAWLQEDWEVPPPAVNKPKIKDGKRGYKGSSSGSGTSSGKYSGGRKYSSRSGSGNGSSRKPYKRNRYNDEFDRSLKIKN
jgi:ATP-dependent RNA helicase DeaD